MILQYHRIALKLAVTCSRRQIVTRGMATANSVVSGRKSHLFPSPADHHETPHQLSASPSAMTKEVFKVKTDNPCRRLISQKLIQKHYAELATKFTRDVIVPQAAEYDRTMVRLYGYRSNLKLISSLRNRNIPGPSSKKPTLWACSIPTSPKL